MSHHRQPDTRTRVLRWLLAVLTVAALGVVGAADCGADAPLPAAATSTAVTHAAEHGDAGHGQSASEVCHLQAAPRAAAATTATSIVQPPAGFRTLPADAPPTIGKPRQPDAVALTDIGISRT